MVSLTVSAWPSVLVIGALLSTKSKSADFGSNTGSTICVTTLEAPEVLPFKILPTSNSPCNSFISINVVLTILWTNPPAV